jgi:hypothetical protein
MARPKPSHTTCVLYDPIDGGVVLMHTVVRLAGAKPGTRKTDEAEARAIAARLPRPPKTLKAVHVPAADLKPDVAYRVSRGKLIAAAARAR